MQKATNIRVYRTFSWKTTNYEGIVPKMRIGVEWNVHTTVYLDDLSMGNGRLLKRNVNIGTYKGKDKRWIVRNHVKR